VQQFMVMSWSGQAGSWFAAMLLWLAVPMDSAGRDMLVCAAIGTAVFDSAVEVPMILRTRKRGNPLGELSRLDRPTLYRSGWIGINLTALLWLAI
jgi:hypothetical protein